MNRDSNFSDGAQSGQGTGFTDLVARLVRLKRRVAAIEGNPIAAVEHKPLPEAVAGIQDLFNSRDPRVAHLQLEFAAMIDRDIDALDRRLDRALGKTALNHRQSFHVIDGGRS